MNRSQRRARRVIRNGEGRGQSSGAVPVEVREFFETLDSATCPECGRPLELEELTVEVIRRRQV